MPPQSGLCRLPLVPSLLAEEESTGFALESGRKAIGSRPMPLAGGPLRTHTGPAPAPPQRASALAAQAVRADAPRGIRRASDVPPPPSLVNPSRRATALPFRGVLLQRLPIGWDTGMFDPTFVSGSRPPRRWHRPSRHNACTGIGLGSRVHPARTSRRDGYRAGKQHWSREDSMTQGKVMLVSAQRPTRAGQP